MNNQKVNQSLQIFIEQYKKFCEEFIAILKVNNIEKTPEDGFLLFEN